MSRMDDWNYYGDERVLNAGLNKAPVIFYEDDEGNEVELELPWKFEVCPTCEGRGKHVNPSIDAGGLTSQDLYDDPDFAEDYMTGFYDVVCYQCDGKRVIPAVDWDRLTEEQAKIYEQHLKDEAAFRYEEMWERRLGC